MSGVQCLNINVNEVANYIFKINTDKEIFININSLKTKKELFFLLFDIFCKGIILMYGENNKMKLNNLELYQFDEIKTKLKYAHIHLNLITYDKETAQMLDLIPTNDQEIKEKNIIQNSIDDIVKMPDNDNLDNYIFHLYMNENLFCINFDILH